MTSSRSLQRTLVTAYALIWAAGAAAGIPATVMRAPVPLTFTSQQVGTTSPPSTETYTVTFGFPGSAVQINSLSASGDFAIAGGTCKTGAANAIPVPAGSCTVLVTFTPSGTGARNGTLTFNCTTVFPVGGGGVACAFTNTDILVALAGTAFAVAAPIPALSPQLLALLAGAILLWTCLTLKRRRD